MEKKNKVSIALISWIGCWSILLVTVCLILSPVGKIKGPVSVIIIPFIVLTIISAIISIVGIAASIIDYKNNKSRYNIINLLFNTFYFLTLAVLTYVLINGGMSV